MAKRCCTRLMNRVHSLFGRSGDSKDSDGAEPAGARAPSTSLSSDAIRDIRNRKFDQGRKSSSDSAQNSTAGPAQRTNDGGASSQSSSASHNEPHSRSRAAIEPSKPASSARAAARTLTQVSAPTVATPKPSASSASAPPARAAPRAVRAAPAASQDETPVMDASQWEQHYVAQCCRWQNPL